MFRMNVDEEIDLVFLEDALAVDLFALVDSEREYLSRWMPWAPETTSVEPIREFIKATTIGFAEGKSMTCAIWYRDAIVGVVGYKSIQPDLKKVEIGYWLSAKQQGKGIMTRACRALIQYAFSDLDMEKVEIAVAVENTPSRKVCERLGLKLEGVITNAENLQGVIVDHAVYGMMRANWEAAI